MQTELAERFHVCASDKQAKVCVRQECQTDLSSVGVSSPASMPSAHRMHKSMQDSHVCNRSDMQTELAERFHVCASDKQAKVCVRQECQTDLSSIGVSSPASTP